MSDYDYSPINLARLEHENSLPAGMLSSLVYAENSPDTAVSPKGAVGRFQVLPETAANPGYGIAPFDPKDPSGIAKLVSAYYQRSGQNPTLTAAAYNAGLGGDYTNPETSAYMKRFGQAFNKGNKVADQPVVAELADGRRLEFPAGTSPDVVQRTVKKVLGQAAPAGAPSGPMGPPESAKPMGWQQEASARFLENIGVKPEKARALEKGMPEFVPDIPGAPQTIQAIKNLAPELGLASPIGKSQTLEQIAAQVAQSRGFKMPPSMLRPGAITEALEGFVNKAHLEREASRLNEPVARGMIAKDLGLPADTPLTQDVLKGVVKEGGKAYQAVRNVPFKMNVTGTEQAALKDLGAKWRALSKNYPMMAKPEIEELINNLVKEKVDPKTGIRYIDKIEPSNAIDLINELRAEASSNLAQTAKASEKALGAEQKKAANLLEDIVARNLRNQPGMMDTYSKFVKGRTLIAKAYEAMKASNATTGTVNPQKYGQMLQAGKPISGGARAVGETAQALKRSTQPIEQMGAQPRFSAIDALWTMANAARHPLLASAAVARPAVRSLLLSDAYQTGMTPTIKEMVNQAIIEASQVGATKMGEQSKR